LTPRRAVGAALLGATLAHAAGCAHRRTEPRPTANGEVALYRGRLQTSDGERRGFRLLLFAAPPDRLHLEVLSPLGPAQLIVDGGGGRLAVTVLAERTSYVGPAGQEAFDKLLGLPVDLGQLVSTVLTGDPAGASLEVERSAAAQGRLPRTLALRSAGVSVSLALQRFRGGPAPAVVGRGEPPPGVSRVRGLDELEIGLVGEAVAEPGGVDR
jgi:hypothetical protein